MVRRTFRSFYRSLQDASAATFSYSRRLAQAYVAFVGRLAGAYVMFVSGALALLVGYLSETLGAGMGTLHDSINSLWHVLDTSIVQVASVVALPVYRGSTLMLSSIRVLERFLRRARNYKLELTPLRMLFIGLVLDLLLSYPVTKLWDYIWGKLFP
jgi:hypothetical protein